MKNLQRAKVEWFWSSKSRRLLRWFSLFRIYIGGSGDRIFDHLSSRSSYIGALFPWFPLALKQYNGEHTRYCNVTIWPWEDILIVELILSLRYSFRWIEYVVRIAWAWHRAMSKDFIILWLKCWFKRDQVVREVCEGLLVRIASVGRFVPVEFRRRRISFLHVNLYCATSMYASNLHQRLNDYLIFEWASVGLALVPNPGGSLDPLRASSIEPLLFVEFPASQDLVFWGSTVKVHLDEKGLTFWGQGQIIFRELEGRACWHPDEDQIDSAVIKRFACRSKHLRP